MASISGRIDRVLDDLAISCFGRFYPTYVAEHAELPLEIVVTYLSKLAELGRLNLYWEVYCDAPGCCRTLVVSSDIRSILGKTLECDMCGEEVEVTENNIFPIFEINKEYKAERRDYFRGLKKKLEVNQGQRLLPV